MGRKFRASACVVRFLVLDCIITGFSVPGREIQGVRVLREGIGVQMLWKRRGRPAAGRDSMYVCMYA